MKQGTLREAEPQASAAAHPAAPKVEAGISSTPLSTIRSPPSWTFGNASREELANVYDKVGSVGQLVGQCYTTPTEGHRLTRPRPSPKERMVWPSRIA